MYHRYTCNQILDILFKNGWIVKNQKGSHIQLTHPTKKGKVTVPKHGNDVLAPGTERAILKQAGLL
jgi:predicted RNA binding protein YcfA (HicA-like mRNA interferase family)